MVHCDLLGLAGVEQQVVDLLVEVSVAAPRSSVSLMGLCSFF